MKHYGYQAGRALMLKKQAALEDIIEAARVGASSYERARRRAGRPKHYPEWLGATMTRPTKDIALIALDWATRPRDTAPKRYQAALELADALAPGCDKPAAIGMQVADMVAEAGVIKTLNPPLGKNRDMSPLTLTPEALASVDHFLDVTEKREPITEPVSGPARVKPTWRSRTSSTASPKVDEAINILRATRWRINPQMLAVMNEHYPKFKGSRLTMVERGALATARRVTVPFYLDGHLDWRGRFNQEGLHGLEWTNATDKTRSLLEFADGYPLDRDTLPFLALHMTSMWGNDVDKGTDTARYQWVADNNVQILQCVSNQKPSKWWRKAKEPFRFLASCYAFRDALDGKPVHLPCSFDVTCSGVGIYAMLVRDKKLAERVNILHPAVTGQPDFYSYFGSLCDPPRPRPKAKDYAKGAMYGSGAGPWEPTPIEVAFWRAMGPDARALFDWLRTLAADGKVLSWTLPDGFTVAHDYRCEVKTIDKAYVQGRRQPIKLERVSITDEFDAVKAVKAIVANFIQSFDGAYLREVVRIGANLDIPAWGVAHDCFSIHPYFGAKLIGPMGAVQQAAVSVFGPDRLAELGWPNPPGMREVLSWRSGWNLGTIVG